MKRSGCKTVISLLVVQFVFLLSFSAFAEDVDKKFTKEFSVDGKEKLMVNNRYGEVKVESWNENKVLVEVLVTVKHPSKDKAEKYLSMIDIEFSENDNTIGALTKLEKNFSFKGGPDSRFSIDYLVKMPADFNLSLINKFGNIEIGELVGHVQIALKHGSLFVGKLSRGKEKPLNSISLSFGKAVIAESGWTELILQHAGPVNIGSAKALLIDSKHSKLQVEEVGSIVAASKHDQYKAESINNIVVESEFTGFSLGEVSGKIDISTEYGSVIAENIKKDFENVEITAKHCKVKLDFDDDASYLLNFYSSFGSFSFDEENAEIKQRIVENNRKTIEAIVGDASSQSVVKIKSSHGSVIVN